MTVAANIRTPMWTGVALSVWLVAIAVAQDPVHFPDENLRKAVLAALGKPADTQIISTDDMLALRGLDAEGRGITDLTGLEHAVHLQWVNLWTNDISDVSPLQGLVELTSVNIIDNRISDISCLFSLLRLEELGACENRISHIRGIAALSNLKTLVLWHNDLSDLSPLRGMTQLEYLYLGANNITDISALEGMIHLRLLKLDGGNNDVSDIRVLEDMNNLEELNLYDNSISDISALAGKTKLEFLHLGGSHVRDISYLKDSRGLVFLDLGANEVADISVLKDMNDLEELGLWNNHVSDISALAGKTKLAFLQLGGNEVHDISHLSDSRGLVELWLEGNDVVDISVVEDMNGLEVLILWDNNVSDISALAGKTKLRSLNLGANQVSDISVLDDMGNLVFLDLGGNQISSISALAGKTQMEELRLWGNRIADIEPLSDMAGLIHLDLRDNPLSAKAYTNHIPQILANNPGIELWYDPPVPQPLRVSSTSGGIVVKPGEGTFEYALGAVVGVEAMASRGYQFVGWTGSAVNLSKVDDPSAAKTTVTVNGEYSLVANFKRPQDLWTVVYSEDFEGEIGPEWSHKIADVTPIGARRFLGQFGNDRAGLSLSSLAEHMAVRVSFDLFIIHSWDGSRTSSPDLWRLAADGNVLIETTFTNFVRELCEEQVKASGWGRDWERLGWWTQAYPGWYPFAIHPPQSGAIETNTLGYYFIDNWVTDPIPMDAVYHLTFWFHHKDPSVDFAFEASELQVLSDESWGVDNVRVELAGAGVELPVGFWDRQLKACVEAHLGVTDPTPSDMLRLTELICTGSGIFDLTGLEHALNLTYLDLSGNQITELFPLLGLTSLRTLNLTGNPLGPDAYVWLLRTNNPGLEISYDTPLTAWVPEPTDKAVGVISPVLRWRAGRTAAFHDVYFGTNAGRLARYYYGRQIQTEYTVPPGLAPGVTYYWRVDEVEADGTTIHEGAVWSFTVADPKLLVVSASPGGSVLTPGEGQFQIEKGTVLGIEAAPAQADYEFLTWTGTAVDSGKVEDPNASATTVLVDADYTLEAVFVERADGPVLGFSVGEIDVDDPNQYYYRVTTNNAPGATFVERVTGVEPDPNGMVRMQVVDGESARMKGRFGRCSVERVLVQFEYLFETADAAEIVVYLSDVPELLGHADPVRDQHYVEIGRVPAPPEGRPGSFGSGRFGVFEEWAFVEGLDLSKGTWVELELVGGAMLAGSPGSVQGGIRLASGDPGGSAVFDSLSVQVHCSGYCLDLNFTKTVDSQDLLLVMAACGSTAELDEGGAGSRYCLDGAFSRDGYVDAYDIHSLIWALSDLSRVDCGNLCRVPLPLCDVGAGVARVSYMGAATGPGLRMAGIGSWPTGLMVLYKDRTDDVFCLFDGDGAYVTDVALPGLPAQGTAQIVRGPQGGLYLVSTEGGVLRLDDSVSSVIPPGEVVYGSARVYIGIQGEGSNCFGRPLLDAAFDSQGYAYVVPVVVEPADGEGYVAAAQLELLEGEGPPYRVTRLYGDRAPANDNRRCNHLREIEVDGAGNVYVLNVHRLNESCVLRKYASDGRLLECLSLLAPSSPAKVADPVALHVTHDGQTLYLVSGQQDREHPDRVVLYGLSTADFSRVRTVTIAGMPVVTSLTEDPSTGSLWVTGFRTTKQAAAFPWLPPEFTYAPRLAAVPRGIATAEATAITGPTSDASMLPTSIIWTGATE